MAYEFLAGCYDAFTADVHYARWADYLEKHFARSRLPIRTVLDLACGTGSLTRVLAERGYEMIGADLSQEMLSQAAEKCRGAGPIEPIFCIRPWRSWISTALSTPACAAWTASTTSPAPKSWPGPSGGCTPSSCPAASSS